MGGLLSGLFGSDDGRNRRTYASARSEPPRTGYDYNQSARQNYAPTQPQITRINRPTATVPTPRNINITRSQVQPVRRSRLVEHGSSQTITEVLTAAGHTESINVKKMIQKTFYNANINSVYKVNNAFLEAMYKLKKEEYISRYGHAPKEMTLFHATAKRNVRSIIQNNFDWRKVVRNKYGVGTSFSEDADYANCHSNRRNGTDRAFIVTRVLVHASAPGRQHQTITPTNVDTTCFIRQRKGLVYVKYCDNEFLPLYVVHYESNNDLISSSPYYEDAVRRRYNNNFRNY